MRTEPEMYDLLLGFAQEDPRVRAVILNGSRTNPTAPKDILRDYDIVYLVEEYESFIADHRWIDVFGPRLVQQLPDAFSYLCDGSAQPGSFGYLMQFWDGNRIDLTLAKKELFEAYCLEDRLSVVLLDKDDFLPLLPPPDERSHFVKQPDSVFFAECRCEFWWVAPYVSKGLWRGQLLFAQKHLEDCLRPQLLRMLSWLVGAENEFAVSPGKCGDKLKDYLSCDDWQAYLATYAPCSEAVLWQALFTAGALFTKASRFVAQALGFSYNDHWEQDVTAFLQYTRALPPTAKTMNFGE